MLPIISAVSGSLIFAEAMQRQDGGGMRNGEGHDDHYKPLSRPGDGPTRARWRMPMGDAHLSYADGDVAAVSWLLTR